MPKAAVLGDPIEHSLSPILHNAGYQAAGLKGWSYERIRTTADGLASTVTSAGEDYRGFSVTMPCKFAALEFATEATERARLIGSANTLIRIAGGWRADNTDGVGILGALSEMLPPGDTPHVLIVGAGGTARPALWAAAHRGAQRVTIMNRSDRAAEFAPLAEALGVKLHFTSFDTDIEAIAESADVIISTVPSAGVAQHAERLAHAPLLDVIYNPRPTPLSLKAAERGHPTLTGEIMLAHQSYPQFESFTATPAPTVDMKNALLAHLA